MIEIKRRGFLGLVTGAVASMFAPTVSAASVPALPLLPRFNSLPTGIGQSLHLSSASFVYVRAGESLREGDLVDWQALSHAVRATDFNGVIGRAIREIPRGCCGWLQTSNVPIRVRIDG